MPISGCTINFSGHVYPISVQFAEFNDNNGGLQFSVFLGDRIQTWKGNAGGSHEKQQCTFLWRRISSQEGKDAINSQINEVATAALRKINLHHVEPIQYSDLNKSIRSLELHF